MLADNFGKCSIISITFIGLLVIGQFSFSLFVIGYLKGSTFTETDRIMHNYRVGPACAGGA